MTVIGGLLRLLGARRCSCGRVAWNSRRMPPRCVDCLTWRLP